MPDVTITALLAHIVGEWKRLKPMSGVQPPSGVWILMYEPIPADTAHGVGIAAPITSAWYGVSQGVYERKVESVQHLRANVEAWSGVPYHRWGWVDLARLEGEPVYYLEFGWGGRYGYGLQAAVTTRGLVLTSSHLWQA
jgi:hypothetical protein